MKEKTIVTTSWDDGHPCDLRLAGLLLKRRLPATFYVPIVGENGRPVLEGKHLRALLSQGFEIGAHTMSHRILRRLSHDALFHEVQGSKDRLEELLGVGVQMFCYPRGLYDSKAIDCVRQSGFVGARTTCMFSHSVHFSRFEMPTSLQAYPHARLAYLKNLGKRRNWAGLTRYFAEYAKCERWVDIGKKLFDEVLHEGGIWHLYGHSWEVEECGLWGQLQEMFEYVANRADVSYASNGEVLTLLQQGSRVHAEVA